MGDLRKVIVWFLVCLALAIYAKVSQIAPVGVSERGVLGVSSPGGFAFK